MNDSDDTFESSHNETVSLSSHKKFICLQPEFEDNDDTQEKKEQNKRNSAILELSLTRNDKNNQNSTSSAFTSEQISHHYGDCMKLASENKITPKNAFDLHLIEYLQNYMYSLQSFQKVSSSLDAGAKIYAGRVDSVHSNTYNIFTGCHITQENTKENDPESAEKVEADESFIENKIRRPKRRAERNMICTNIRKIRLTPAHIRSEADPLFQNQAKTYDEGGTEELRLNNIKLLDDTYGIMLDTESIIKMNSPEYDDNKLSKRLFNISEFLTMFQELTLKEFPISSEFNGFKFSGWDPNSETMNSEAAEIFKNLMNKESDQMEIIDCEDYDDMQMLESGDANVCDVDITISSKGDEEEDNMLAIGSSKTEEGSSFFVSSVKEFVNSYIENYGEINDDILGMWAGPDHWKRKAKGIRPLNIISDKSKVLKVGKVNREIPPIFPVWVSTCINRNNVGRLVDIQCKGTDSKPSAVSTELTDICLTKNIKKEYILPTRNQFVLKSINQLMNRDVSLVNKALKKHAEKMSSIKINENQEICPEDNNGENIYEELVEIDVDGNLSKHMDEIGDGESCSSDDDPYTGNSFRNCNFDDFDTKMTDDIPGMGIMDISYAKIAKRINVKRIKQEMLFYLNDKIHMENSNVIRDNVYPNIHMSKDVCHLSDLLANVDKNVSPEVSKELSVSILMTCLLHVANETRSAAEMKMRFPEVPTLGWILQVMTSSQIYYSDKGTQNMILNKSPYSVWIKIAALNLVKEKQKRNQTLEAQNLFEGRYFQTLTIMTMILTNFIIFLP